MNQSQNQRFLTTVRILHTDFRTNPKSLLDCCSVRVRDDTEISLEGVFVKPTFGVEFEIVIPMVVKSLEFADSDSSHIIYFGVYEVGDGGHVKSVDMMAPITGFKMISDILMLAKFG